MHAVLLFIRLRALLFAECRHHPVALCETCRRGYTPEELGTLGHHPRSHLPESHVDEAIGADGGSSRLPTIRPALLPLFGLRLGEWLHERGSCPSFFPKELLEFRARPSVLLKEPVHSADLFLVAGQGAPIPRIEKVQKCE